MKKFPVGTDDFREIVTGGYYYVDKTRLVEELVDMGSEVTLFTRPRRFGKSINMSMLRHFFELGADGSLFRDLYIGHNKDICDEFLGKFPVVSISMKDLEGRSFEDACDSCALMMGEVARSFGELLYSDRLEEDEKQILRTIRSGNFVNVSQLAYSLNDLMVLLAKHYESQVVVLIDEYDVPLSKAFENGYYDDMVMFVRKMFSKALKSNSNLKFAVLTGCLRISKESVFTGLNNFKVNSITDIGYDEMFGFTDEETSKLLKYYGLEGYYNVIREWYDGYHFGDVDVYCPWDVVNYCQDLTRKTDMHPQKYWMNSSSNDIVNRFIDYVVDADLPVKGEFVKLVQGEAVTRRVRQDITYRDLYSSIDNIWSALFMTGYLTCREGYNSGDCELKLVVPNREIRAVWQDSFIDRFERCHSDSAETVRNFYAALQQGNVAVVEETFTHYLGDAISVRNANARLGKKENFYQGIFLGMLILKSEWKAKTEYENGDGYTDLSMHTDDSKVGVIIEFKYTDSEKNLDKACEQAMTQINNRNYANGFFRQNEEAKIIYQYGIACHLKKCRAIVERVEREK